LYPYCDFFIHTWDINKQKCYNLSNVFSKETKLTDDEIQTIKQNYNPKKFVVENYKETYDTLKKYESHSYSDVQIFNVIQPLWYSFYKSVELKNEYENQNGIKYDYVIKLRPDIKFHPHRRFSQDLEMYKEEFKSGEFFIENLVREWTLETHTIDDVYFISSSEKMNVAATYYEKWIEWGLTDRTKPHYGFIRHAVLNNLKLCPFKRRDWGGESGYVVLRPECLKYVENTISNYTECKACEDYFYGNPKSKPLSPIGFYINLLKNKYIISETDVYYLDELVENENKKFI
jgi:hypothetical protein